MPDRNSIYINSSVNRKLMERLRKEIIEVNVVKLKWPAKASFNDALLYLLDYHKEREGGK